MVPDATGSINSLMPQMRLNLMRSAHTVIQEDKLCMGIEIPIGYLFNKNRAGMYCF